MYEHVLTDWSSAASGLHESCGAAQRPAAMVQQRVSKKDPWTDTTSGQNTARRRGFRGAGSLPLTQCDQKVQSVGCALT